MASNITAFRVKKRRGGSAERKQNGFSKRLPEPFCFY
jgi:hypothetical protein